MMHKQKKTTTLRIFTMLFIIIILAYASSNTDTALIENLSIPSGISWDLENKSELKYKQGFLIYEGSNKANKNYGYFISTEGISPSASREYQNLELSKKIPAGFERVNILSEKLAYSGIKNILNFTLMTPQVSDKVYFVICKGEASDILKYTDKKNTNAGETIEGLIKTAPDYNFFSKKFTFLDILMSTGAEGKNIILPYVELSDKGIMISGLALFKSDRMIAATNMKEAKYINLLKFNNVKGLISIQKNAKEYIDFLAKSKRKVKCYKNNDNYKFIIELVLNGQVTDNELYKNLFKDAAEIKKLEKDIEKQVMQECKIYIEKINKQYKTDVLDLGDYAASKYGRDTDADWNKIVSNSDIEIKVKAKLIKQGRGSL